MGSLFDVWIVSSRDPLSHTTVVVHSRKHKDDVWISLHHRCRRSKHRVVLHAWSNDLWIFVTVLNLVAVLRLHACAHRTVHHLGSAVNQGRGFLQLRLNESCNLAKTSKTLEGHHGIEEAVIALCVLNLHLILQEISCRHDRVWKAAKGFQAQAHLWRVLFSAPS